jgi:hypothetical protein
MRVVSLTMLGGVVQLAPADPMRVAIMFDTFASGGFSLGPTSGVTITTGINISSGRPLVVWLHRDVGPLVQGEWWGIASGSVTVTIVEVKLIDWPTKGRHRRERQAPAT